MSAKLLKPALAARSASFSELKVQLQLPPAKDGCLPFQKHPVDAAHELRVGITGTSLRSQSINRRQHSFVFSINFTATRLCLRYSDNDLDLNRPLPIRPTVAPRSFREQLSSFTIVSELLKFLVIESITRNTFTNL